MRFNGVDIHDVDRRISVNKEIPPGMPRREIHTVRGNATEHLGGLTLERDEYIVRVNIAARSADEAWRVREKLAAWAMSSGEETAALVPTHRADVFYDAIVSSIEAPEFNKGFATVNVVFLLPDPTAREIMESSAHGSTEIELTIGGTVEARPVITVSPTASIGFLRCLLDGKAIMAIEGSFSPNSVVVYDYVGGRVTVDGEDANSLIDYAATKWRPGFTPGKHTLLCPNQTIDVRWHNRWA